MAHVTPSAVKKPARKVPADRQFFVTIAKSGPGLIAARRLINATVVILEISINYLRAFLMIFADKILS
jgi:hypothetical protein